MLEWFGSVGFYVFYVTFRSGSSVEVVSAASDSGYCMRWCFTILCESF